MTLFTVLKIIGIVILVLLGLILFVLLLVLFVPVRYRGSGSYQNGTFMTTLRGSWLLHIVSVMGAYQNGQELHLVLRIFGIPFFDTFRNKKAKPTKRFLKLFSLAKIKDFFTKFVNFFKKIKFTFDKVCDTMVRIKKNIKYYLELLQRDSTKQALSVCWGQFGRIVKKVAPRKFRVNLHLGFEDPAVMGQVLAVWGMLYPLHLGAVDIQPEFDQVVLEGDFSFQGKVSVIVFVHAGCVLLFNKDLKGLIKSLRQKEK